MQKLLFLNCFLFCLAINVFCLTNVCAENTSNNCAGDQHVHRENKNCIYDISYPVLSNKKSECVVRKWIDKEASDYQDWGDLDPEMGRKNEFWITCETFNSKTTESVVIQEYQYDQGANGSTVVKSFTFDVKSGKEYKLFDVLDSNKDWFGALLPFINKYMNSNTQVIITRENATSDIFKSAAIDGEDLVIYFDQETVGPHSSGVVKIRFPMKSLKGVLKVPFSAYQYK